MAPQINRQVQNITPIENYPVRINGNDLDTRTSVLIKANINPLNNTGSLDIQIKFTEIAQLTQFMSQFQLDIGI